MAEKPRNKYADLLKYFGMRVAGTCVQIFNINSALTFGRLLGNLVYLVDKPHRQRAIDNLRAAYGSTASEDWIRKTARTSMEHLGMLLMEVLYTPRLVKVNTSFRYVSLDGVPNVLRLLVQDRPVIMLSGHYGNWELMSFAMATLGFSSYSVARHLPNPYIHEYVFGIREKTGQRILTKKGATTTVTEVLEQNQIICFLADQDAGRRGVFVDFFGRKASTFRSIALLAIRYNTPIAVMAATRQGKKFQYKLSVEEVIHPEQWKDRQDEVGWITATYTKAIERVARRCPGQYFWVHRRWKTRPKGEKAGDEGNSG